MNIDARITRRQVDAAGLVLDDEAISPVAHLADPVGRGPTLETLLDYLDPILDGDLPPDAYVWGPAGAGKSAVVTALFAHLQPRPSRLGAIVHTATRARPDREPPQSFVYVDARAATTDFGLYHAILDGIVDESVPTQGVRTDTLLTQLRDALAPSSRRAVVAVDHVGEADTYALSALAERLDGLGDSLALLAIGRDRPAALEDPPAKRIEMPAYDTETLISLTRARRFPAPVSRWRRSSRSLPTASEFCARCWTSGPTTARRSRTRPPPSPRTSTFRPGQSNGTCTSSPTTASSSGSGWTARRPAGRRAASSPGSRRRCSDGFTSKGRRDSSRCCPSQTPSPPVTSYLSRCGLPARYERRDGVQQRARQYA